jgi:hypothetical protein
MIPEQLAQEAEVLRAEGQSVDLIEAEGLVNLVLHSYPLPPGYNKATTELLVKIPASYPNGRPDMFWVDEDLLLKDGRCPRSADLIETILGKKWRRFSWHPQGWNPGTDNLRTYLEFVNARLAKLE